VRANQIDEDLAVMLGEAGCWQVSFGVESGDPEVLRAHRRASNLDDIREKVALLKKRSMRVKGLFIVGLPGEDESAILRSIDYALSVDFDEINVSKFTPFPGAPLYATIREHGTFDEEWERMNLLNFVFVPKALTGERLEELYREFIKRFYQRPGTAWKYTKLMLREPQHVLTVARHARQFLPYLHWVRTGRKVAT
jgi:anaerobic magnesium-protoporphyrin IX monomethyl ester cyclase